MLAVMRTGSEGEKNPLLMPDLPPDPLERLKAIMKWLKERHENQRLNCCLEVVDRTELRRRMWSPCEPTDPSTETRVPKVVDALLQFCGTHQKALDREPQIWMEIHGHILERLNEKTQRRHAKSIGVASDRISKLASKISSIRWPNDWTIFPHLPSSAPDPLRQACDNPWRYDLSFEKTGPKSKRVRALILKDRIRNERTVDYIPYSLRRIDPTQNSGRWVLVSKKTAGEGAFTKARICWDLSLGAWLVQKSKGIQPGAQHIIQQISEKQVAGVVPIWTAEHGKWRMYETYCQMDLFTILTRCTLDLQNTCLASLQLLTSLADLHQQQYRLPDGNTCPAFHGDIKPENILCTSQNQLVFTDFGSTDPNMVAGTYLYAAPEVLELYNGRRQGKRMSGSKEFRQAQDVWSMGVVLVQLLRRECRHFLPCVDRIAHALAANGFSECPISQEELDRDLADFKSRLRAPSEIAPIWICIEKMLRVDPKERISAQDALSLFHRANRERFNPT